MRWRLRRPGGERSPVREAVTRYVAIGLVAVALISIVGVWLFRRAGVAEATRDAKDQTRIAAEVSVEPALSNAILQEKPGALAALDRVIQERVLSRPDDAVARVKIWDETGRIVYSDEAALIGKRYPFSAQERADLKSGRVEAEVSDLSKPENRYERGMGKLLEVYLPIRTPSGRPLRFEMYYRSSFISARAARIFRQFAPVMIGALVLLALIQLPLAWWLARRVQRGQDERERLLRRAIDASDVERRRIARDLHDGVVQDLAAVSYSLAAAAEEAPAPYDSDLRTAAAETRHGIGQLRTLLVDIYPPELHRAGLPAALGDLLGCGRRTRPEDLAGRRSGPPARARDRGALLPHRAGGGPERCQARGRRVGDACGWPRPRPAPGSSSRTTDAASIRPLREARATSACACSRVSRAMRAASSRSTPLRARVRASRSRSRRDPRPAGGRSPPRACRARAVARNRRRHRGRRRGRRRGGSGRLLPPRPSPTSC